QALGLGPARVTNLPWSNRSRTVLGALRLIENERWKESFAQSGPQVPESGEVLVKGPYWRAEPQSATVRHSPRRFAAVRCGSLRGENKTAPVRAPTPGSQRIMTASRPPPRAKPVRVVIERPFGF